MKKDEPDYHKKRKARWYAKTRSTRHRKMADWRKKTRDAAVAALGGRCSCCGERHESMLDIDHVYNDGQVELAKFCGNNYRIYQNIIAGESGGRHQILCSNCNQSKKRNGGWCQHYTDRWMAFTGMDSVLA